MHGCPETDLHKPRHEQRVIVVHPISIYRNGTEIYTEMYKQSHKLAERNAPVCKHSAL